jgi:hypothetical protein
VPRVCEFDGIEIYMYHDDHPWPHFHVLYAEYSCSVRIDTLAVIGTVPPRISRRVRRWAELRRAELLANAERAERFEALLKIAPPPR